LETNCTDNQPNTFALRSPKAIHPLPGKHGKIWRRLEVWWEKVSCWSTTVAIGLSLKRVKIEELLLRAYRNSPTLFRTVPSPTPYEATASSSPRLGVRHLHSILQSLSSANFKFGQCIHRVHPNKSPHFLSTSVISGTGKATNLKFCTHIHRIDWNISPLKMSGKVALGVVRNSAFLYYLSHC